MGSRRPSRSRNTQKVSCHSSKQPVNVQSNNFSLPKQRLESPCGWANFVDNEKKFEGFVQALKLKEIWDGIRRLEQPRAAEHFLWLVLLSSSWCGRAFHSLPTCGCLFHLVPFGWYCFPTIERCSLLLSVLGGTTLLLQSSLCVFRHFLCFMNVIFFVFLKIVRT